MTVKDAAATLWTALAVLVFAAVHEGWNVPLVGDSVRWATGAILLLGMFGCASSAPARDVGTRLAALLGVAALGLAIAALVTGSLTVLSLLVVAVVLLWLVATVRHATHPRRAAAA